MACWGGVISVVAYLLYGSWSLGVVMTAAMTLNLLLAALMGVLIPMTLAGFRVLPWGPVS
jgi:magnesium transporter